MGASAVLKLQKAGFTTEQVEALAEFLDAQAVGKADLEQSEHRLAARLEQSEHRQLTRLLETKAELKADNAALEVRLIRCVVGTGAAAVLAIVAAVRYLPHG